jgi:hypothetical protein
VWKNESNNILRAHFHVLASSLKQIRVHQHW